MDRDRYPLHHRSEVDVAAGAHRLFAHLDDHRRPQGNRSRLVVFIDYQLPPRGLSHGLGLLFGRAYAGWCTRRMATDAMAAMSPTNSNSVA